MADNETFNEPEVVSFGQLLEGAPEFDAHERWWRKTHKYEVPKLKNVSWWTLGLAIMLWLIISIGASLVSGAHSVPAILFTIPQTVTSPIREVLALAGFTIFELMIFATALYRRESWWATGGLVLSYVGALAANMGSSIVATQANNGSEFDMAVAIVLAVMAPTAAFLAGEMLHRKVTEFNNQLEQARVEYRYELSQMQRKIRDDYSRKYVKRQPRKAKTDEIRENSRNDLRNDNNSRNSTKQPRKSIEQIAKEIWEAGDHTLRGTVIAEKYGIANSSVTKAKNIIAVWESERGGSDIRQ